MATIFGSNLADSAAPSPLPWTTPLGGTEVHLAGDDCFAASCDLVASLIYASPAQINFLVPETGSTKAVPYRLVLVRDGQRFDDPSYLLGGPGRLIIDPSGTADSSVVFQVGYDCLFSASLSDAAACGLSWSSGQDRAPVGAITDSQTGLETARNMAPVGFGVAQFGKDIEGTLGVRAPAAPDTPSVPVGTFQSPKPLWAGESPQYVGLDQVNVAFPTCTGVPLATSENRYDAFLTYTSLETGTTSRLYLPFAVRVGDPDCQWVNTKTATSISLAPSPSPSTTGEAVILTANVSPTTATGVATFFDASTMLGTRPLSGGAATLSVSSFAAGTHTLTVLYNGDNNCTGSTAGTTLTVGARPTTIIVASNPNPVAFWRPRDPHRNRVAGGRDGLGDVPGRNLSPG